MKKFLQKFSSFKFEDEFFHARRKCFVFINSHPEIFCLGLLALACLAFLFFGIGAYPLIDVDETRYAVMARDLFRSTDWNSLMLNGVPFLEKPPLYFWLVGGSIELFGRFSPFVVRLPIAALSSFLIFFTYYVGKRVISRKFGLISALVLLSSIFFLILAHVAILDMVLTVFIASALYCAFLTYLCQEKNKKYYWWAFYFFVGLGFLSKGLLALAIPAVIVLIYNLITKTAKDIFKPINIIPGVVLLLAMITPWHAIMYKEYGYQFVKEYFLLHHFARFMNSVSIGRERHLLYFIPVFLLGFMPWTFVFISFLCDGFKKIVAKFKSTEGKIKDKLSAIFETTTNEQKLLVFFSIAFAVIFAVFSSSSTKLPTYILPAFPAAAFLMGYYWLIADERGEHQKAIFNSTFLLSTIFVVASIGAFIAYYFLPFELQHKLMGFKNQVIAMIFLSAVFLQLRLKTKKVLSVFFAYVLIMLVLMVLAVSYIFNFVYQTGQNEIVRYSTYAANPKDKSQLVTFDFAVKPSVMINYQAKVNFLTDADFKKLDSLLTYEDGPTFVIVKNKNFKDNEKYLNELEKRLDLVNAGERYSLFAINLAKKTK